MKIAASCEGREYELELIEEGGQQYLVDGEEKVPVDLFPGTGPVRRIRIGEREVVFGLKRSGSSFQIVIDALDYDIEVRDPRVPRPSEGGGGGGASTAGGRIVAPIPGRVVRVLIEPGASVERGAPLLVLDAMKLENEIASPITGTVASVLVAPGDTVQKDQVLAEVQE